MARLEDNLFLAFVVAGGISCIVHYIGRSSYFLKSFCSAGVSVPRARASGLYCAPRWRLGYRKAGCGIGCVFTDLLKPVAASVAIFFGASRNQGVQNVGK